MFSSLFGYIFLHSRLDSYRTKNETNILCNPNAFAAFFLSIWHGHNLCLYYYVFSPIRVCFVWYIYALVFSTCDCRSTKSQEYHDHESCWSILLRNFLVPRICVFFSAWKNQIVFGRIKKKNVWKHEEHEIKEEQRKKHISNICVNEWVFYFFQNLHHFTLVATCKWFLNRLLLFQFLPFSPCLILNVILRICVVFLKPLEKVYVAKSKSDDELPSSIHLNSIHIVNLMAYQYLTSIKSYIQNLKKKLFNFLRYHRHFL